MAIRTENHDDLSLFKNRLWKLMEDRGYGAPRELAEALFLSDSFIAKLESITHQTISIDTLEDIANVLECDIRDFFDKDI